MFVAMKLLVVTTVLLLVLVVKGFSGELCVLINSITADMKKNVKLIKVNSKYNLCNKLELA